MKYKGLIAAMRQIEDNNTLSEEIIIDAMKEALAKAYAKHTMLPDVQVRVDFNPKDEQIHLYQQRTVVETVDDDEFEVSLEDAKKINPLFEVGSVVEEEVSMEGFSRQAVTLVKNVLKQKIREAQKQSVYDEYIDKLSEIVIGTIDKVEERFVLVRLDKAVAMMPKNAQMPQERYVEGQPIKVVITEVNRDTKGSQVLVSRAHADLVKRLFENEVPEIYQGIVEIMAIAREAGERTKMAVRSHKAEVDPIGACIGPRGARVQVVIEELKGEKVDIFEWSDNVSELIKNALSPAKVVAVLPTEDPKNLLVVVEDDQLSLAIGKKGKNVRLAVTLTQKKIDIKTRSDVLEMGIDIEAKLAEMAAKEAAERLAKEREELERLQELERQRREMEAAQAVEVTEEVTEEVTVEIHEQPQEEEVPLFEEVAQPEEKVVEKKRKPKLTNKASEYVSKFEALADASSNQQAQPVKTYKKKDWDKKDKDDDRRLKAADLLKDKEYEIRPEYSEEELEEIEYQEELNENQWDEDIDSYEEYEEYYD
ncbi:MAG: transcription termination/antitermination protein NusA [Erysipelotrichaceae bacterium]|nr:transcription termination/antitermination protein NusA [Erysipelotrichaceae bacterium]